MRRYPSSYMYKRFLLILTREVWWHAEIPKRLSVQTISVNPDPWSQVTCRDTQAVIRTKRFLLTLTREVGWHAGNTLCLSTPFVSQGQTSPLTCRDQHRLLHLLSSRDSESGDMRGIPYGYPHLSSTKASESMVSGWCWSSDSDYFFLNFFTGFTFVIQRHSSPTTRKILHC